MTRRHANLIPWLLTVALTVLVLLPSAILPSVATGRTATDVRVPAGSLLGRSLQDPALVVEYIAHACFVIHSTGGTRVVIDPFNSNTWLGYSFPDGIDADAVLVTHPHYDHDATYYFGNDAPVFRAPATFELGDMKLRGVASEHAGGVRFLDRGQTPYNTIWILETGGFRVAHMGDNRMLTAEDLEAVGDVDIFIVQAQYFLPQNAEGLALLREMTTPSTLIPMHYRHEELSELPRGMRTIDELLGDREPFRYDTNVAEFLAMVSFRPEIAVLRPSPEVEPWPQYMHDAWDEANEGKQLLSESYEERDEASREEMRWEALGHLEQAEKLAPQVLAFIYSVGRTLAELERIDDAIWVLSYGLANGARSDWTDRLRVRMLLAELYEATEHPEMAVPHYEWAAGQEITHETSLRDWARERLEELRRR